MRLKKDVLRARVKGSIDIEFTEEPLSAYAGLELFGRFMVSSGWPTRLRPVPDDASPLQWMLLTTVEVTTPEDALEKLDWHAKC